MTQFTNKDLRARWWDYRLSGSYFITICTKNRTHYLGEIKNEKMILSPLGVIADLLWHEIKNHFSIVKLDAFIVMPNHVHGIIHLNPDAKHGNNFDLQQHRPEGFDPQSRFQNQGKKSISSIIGAYKSAVSYHAHRLGFEFYWHSRFHDHIIRNEASLEHIRNYIINNPQKWADDKFHTPQ